MESPKLADLKKELNFLEAPELKELCLRLAKHKTENKELLHYLLFYADKKDLYVEDVKNILSTAFSDLHPSVYTATKQIRKVLRLANKHIKFIAVKHLEAEIVASFCEDFITHPIAAVHQKATIGILYNQLKRLHRVIAKLDEDLQFDYQSKFDELLGLLKQKRPCFSEKDLQ